MRVRPKVMNVAVIVAGFLPILFGHGAGSKVMRRIAAPTKGGMLTAPLLIMLVVPAAYLLLRRALSTQTYFRPALTLHYALERISRMLGGRALLVIS